MSLQSDQQEGKYKNFIVSRHKVTPVSVICCTDKQSWNSCSSMLFAAQAPECSSEFWRWQEPAAGGGLSAPRPAGVSTELCGRCYGRQLPNSASSLCHSVGKLCEEHCSKVCTNSSFSVEKHLRVCFGTFIVKAMICEHFKTLSLPFVPFSADRKGLRVITESEIGLAAIYASCDKYCNPSCPTPDSGG